MTEKKNIFDLNMEGLENLVLEFGEKKFRAKQLWQGLYQSLWHRPIDFHVLPNNLIARLDAEYSFSSLIPIQEAESSDQQTKKVLFQLQDGKAIETVLMSYESRRTVCISTQVGCALGCVFCATGQMGFTRNLSSGEILEQVLYFERLLRQENEKLTNVVVMGMGEPFLNYKNTLEAIERLNDSTGFNFGARRFTISTAGIVPAIKRFAHDNKQVNLAISLHTAAEDARSLLMPINKKYPLSELIDACQYYVDQTNRRVTFEYALIQGTNDKAQDAHQIGALLKNLLCHVNLIPLNPTEGYKGSRSSDHNVTQFIEILESYQIPCTLRVRRGIDIQAGCGQLAKRFD